MDCVIWVCPLGYLLVIFISISVSLPLEKHCSGTWILLSALVWKSHVCWHTDFIDILSCFKHHLKKSTRPEVALFLTSLLEVLHHIKPVVGFWDVVYFCLFVWLVGSFCLCLCGFCLVGLYFVYLVGFFKKYLFFLCNSYLQYFEIEFLCNSFAFLSLTCFYKTKYGGRMAPELNLSGNRNLLWEKWCLVMNKSAMLEIWAV